MFGDSCIFGDETADGHDVASFLQQQFIDAGLPQIEVINFGVSGFGVHQAYLLWQALGRKYECDYAVFYPLLWHVDRDRRFLQPRNYSPLHARFIYRGRSLKLVPVLGRTRAEAMRIFYQPIPPWRYLRFDSNPPSYLNALLPNNVERGKNPFYYRPFAAPVEEAATTYGLIFNELERQVATVIAVISQIELEPTTQHISAPNVHILRSRLLSSIEHAVYEAPHGHLSALGNELRATELFHFIRETTNPTVNVLKIRSAHSESPWQGTVEPLHCYTSVAAGLQHSPIMGFVQWDNRRYLTWSDICVPFHGSQFASLLELPGADAAQLRFLPLTFLMKEGTPLTLSLDTGSKRFELPIGKLETNGGVIGRMVLNPGYDRLPLPNGGAVTVEPIAETFSALRVTGAGGAVTHLQILAGSNPLLRGQQRGVPAPPRLLSGPPGGIGQVFDLVPVTSEFCYLRGLKGLYVPVSSLPPGGCRLNLILYRADGSHQAVPTFLRCEIQPWPLRHGPW